MKNFSPYIAALCTALVILSCGGKTSPPKEEKVATLADYKWLEGTWYAHGMDFFESWKILNDSTYIGEAFGVEGTDTTVNERILLDERKGIIKYKPVVRRQNNGEPVTFTAVVQRENMVQFENMEHDFPNRIVYFKHSNKQIDVRLEEVNGTMIGRTYDIVMTKVE